jgi:hypothetical protein
MSWKSPVDDPGTSMLFIDIAASPSSDAFVAVGYLDSPSGRFGVASVVGKECVYQERLSDSPPFTRIFQAGKTLVAAVAGEPEGVAASFRTMSPGPASPSGIDCGY